MENESSVTALTLDSMVEVSGMYPNQKSRILLTLAPIKYDNFLFPNAAYSAVFLVSVPYTGIEALNFVVMLDYAHTTGLMLNNPMSMQQNLQSCPGGKLLKWPIAESELRSFTEGPQALYSDWCGDPKAPGGPSIKAWLATPAAARALGSQVNVSSRDYTFPLGGDSKP